MMILQFARAAEHSGPGKPGPGGVGFAEAW